MNIELTNKELEERIKSLEAILEGMNKVLDYSDRQLSARISVLEDKPRATLELTEDEISRLLYLMHLGIVKCEVEHSRDSEMADFDDNLLNKLNEK